MGLIGISPQTKEGHGCLWIITWLWGNTRPTVGWDGRKKGKVAGQPLNAVLVYQDMDLSILSLCQLYEWKNAYRDFIPAGGVGTSKRKDLWTVLSNG